ncbi:MAG: histidine kinase [Flavisolibacter sp.]|nr:histidine kinase [Flavisolibacter sp.]
MDKPLEKARKYNWDHVLLWLALTVYLAINQKHLIAIGGPLYYLKDISIKVLLLMFLTYTNLYVLVPFFWARKMYMLYIVFVSLIIGVYVFIHNFLDLYYFGTLLKVPGYTFHASTFPNISNAILFGCFGIALKLSKQYYLQQQQLHKIQVEKLDTELKYLKAQINPHAIFNSINSIFSLIDKTNTTARTALAKFSEILRYQLYESSMDKIDIGKELNYLNNFVALQRLRKESNVVIVLCVTEKVTGFQIAPLLIVPFVENAFKYVSDFEEQENRIEVCLDCQADVFTLKIFNTCESLPLQKGLLSGGIGLSNVKRRLELLYPNKFNLAIDHTESYYSVALKLDVS